jgi:hypothetical protein
MTAIALVLFMSAAAGADDAWLEVRNSARCPTQHLAERIVERIIGERNGALKAQVELHSEAGAIAAALRISRGAETMGEKLLVAPTCDEALAAVAAVVALALSHPRESPPRAGDRIEDSLPPALGPAAARAVSAPLPEAEPSPPARPQARLFPRRAPRRTASFERDVLAPTSEARPLEFRFVGAAGVDVGTLAEPTAVLGAGTRAGGVWGELRGFAWYGLPSTREEVSVTTERTRADFLALTLDYCHGLDRARWLGLCAGVETSLSRTWRLRQAAEQAAREEERLEPTFGPLLSAAFAYRAARWVPELDVSLRLPMPEASGLSKPRFRAAIGAALPF